MSAAATVKVCVSCALPRIDFMCWQRQGGWRGAGAPQGRSRPAPWVSTSLIQGRLEVLWRHAIWACLYCFVSSFLPLRVLRHFASLRGGTTKQSSEAATCHFEEVQSKPRTHVVEVNQGIGQAHNFWIASCLAMTRRGSYGMLRVARKSSTYGG